MEKSDKPLEGISNMVTKNFELTNKAMVNYLDFFQKNTKNSPWLETAATSQSEGFSRLLADSDRVLASAMEGFN